MENKTFDNDEFKKQFGLEPRRVQQYDFERYKRYNLNLTEPAYKHLRQSGAEWKILCGLEVYTHWGSELLKEAWWLKNNKGYMETDFYKYRFAPENYLNLKTW